MLVFDRGRAILIYAMKHTHKEKQLTALATVKVGLANIIASPEGISVKARKRATERARDIANSALISCLILGDDEELVGEANLVHTLADQVNDIR